MVEPDIPAQNRSVRQPLRVGVLLADLIQPHWICEMLDDLSCLRDC